MHTKSSNYTSWTNLCFALSKVKSSQKAEDTHEKRHVCNEKYRFSNEVYQGCPWDSVSTFGAPAFVNFRLVHGNVIPMGIPWWDVSHGIPIGMTFPRTSLGLSMGHIYLSHSHPIAIYACPIPWDVSHGIPIGMTFPWTSLKFTNAGAPNVLTRIFRCAEIPQQDKINTYSSRGSQPFQPCGPINK